MRTPLEWTVFTSAGAVLMFAPFQIEITGSQSAVAQTSERATRTNADRFQRQGTIDDENPASPGLRAPATEAPTGFDNLTNGFTEQGPPFEVSTKTMSRRCVRSTTTGSSSKRRKR